MLAGRLQAGSTARRLTQVLSKARTVYIKSGDGSVEDLLARDRKGPKQLADTAEFLTDAPAQPSAAPTTASISQPESKIAFKSKRARREEMAKAADSKPDPNRPRRCKQAIDAGLDLFQKKEYEKAIEMFSLALELPGNGAYRLPGSPREYSCPSDAEEQAALYNMACAWAQLGQAEAALTCLEGVLELEFEDIATIRTDPDLAPLRGPALDRLLSKYENPAAKVFKMFEKKKVQESDGKKPWILW